MRVSLRLITQHLHSTVSRDVIGASCVPSEITALHGPRRLIVHPQTFEVVTTDHGMISDQLRLKANLNAYALVIGDITVH